MNFFLRVIRKLKSIIAKFHRPLYASVSYLTPGNYLENRTAFITGGTSGIGYAIAKAFAANGATIVISGRNEERVNSSCERLKNELKDNHGIFGIVMDNTKTETFASCFSQVLEMVKPNKIDILVNNAGVIGGHISNSTEEEYDLCLDTNLKGTFFLSQIVAKYMKTNNIHGNILNIASSSSLRPAASAYTISKWGIRGFTIGLAKVLIPYHIVVNGVAPGPTATPLLNRDALDDISCSTNPLGRYAVPEEIANMATILVSNLGRTIVGDIVYMTGGEGIFDNSGMDYSF